MVQKSEVGVFPRLTWSKQVGSLTFFAVLALVGVSNLLAQDAASGGGWMDSPGGRALLSRLQETEQNIGRLENRVPPLTQRVQSLFDRVFALESPAAAPEPKPEEEGFKEVTFRPPLAYASDKLPLILIFENGRVTMLDIPAVLKVANQHWDQTKQSGTWQVQVPGSHFNVTYKTTDRGNRRTSYQVVRKAGQGHQGETAAEFAKPGSEVNTVIMQTDRANRIVSCTVYPDSFAVFRTVRQLAWKRQLDLGWEPFKSGGSLYIGGGTTTGQ